MRIVVNCKEATTPVMPLMHMVYTLRCVFIYRVYIFIETR